MMNDILNISEGKTINIFNITSIQIAAIITIAKNFRKIFSTLSPYINNYNIFMLIVQYNK